MSAVADARPIPVPEDAARALTSSSEENAARALALSHGLEYVDVGSFAPDPEILKVVPVELMFRYTFLPYRREGERLVLVMADPTDIPVVDELSLLLQTPVQPAVGTASAIQEALKKGQGTTRVLEQASESFKIQIVRDDDNGDEVLSIDKIQADQSPIIRLVDSTVFDALNRRASDIHIETRDNEVVIKYRIDGVLQPAMKPIAKEHHSTIISRIKVMSELDIAEKRVPQDGRFKLRVPLLGDVYTKYSVAGFTRTLATVLGSGIPIVESLKMSVGTLNNKVLERKLLQAVTRVEEGTSLSTALEGVKLMPPLALRMIGVGETTGSLEEMLRDVSDYFEEEIDRRLHILTTAIEPAIMVVMGIVIGAIIITMYLPVFKIAGTVG